MPRLPRKRSRGRPEDIEWDAMVDYLASIRPQPSTGTQTSQYPHGVFRKTRPGDGSTLPPTITVTACDPNTGKVVTYKLYGKLIETDDEDDT